MYLNDKDLLWGLMVPVCLLIGVGIVIGWLLFA